MTLDGSYGEGGGAILRQALGLSIFTGRPIRVVRIRAGRREPGLRPQHLKAVEAAALVSEARVEGAEPGSQEILFAPGPTLRGGWTLDVGTAGSVSLVLQAVLLPGLCTPGPYRFTLTGGTDTTWSPPVDYLARVTAAALEPFGRLSVEVERRGYYPKGGGRVTAGLDGRSGPWPPLAYEGSPRVAAVRGRSHAAATLAGREVAERQARAAKRRLARLGVPVEVEVEYAETFSPGSGIVLWTEGSVPPLGASALGERGRPAEAVGEAAARDLLSEIEAGAGVDHHLADQLVPFLAAAGGRLRTSRLTGHTRSNLYVAELILGTEFRVDEAAGTIEAVRRPRG